MYKVSVVEKLHGKVVINTYAFSETWNDDYVQSDLWRRWRYSTNSRNSSLNATK